MNKDTFGRVLQWFANGEKGISSEAIATTICGLDGGYRKDTPSDPSDFKRCLLLLKAVPELRCKLHLMRSVSKEWNTLIDHWDEIEACFVSEVPEWLDGHSMKSAPKTYALMQKFAKEHQ